MSLEIRKLYEEAATKPKTRRTILKLRPDRVYDDGRTEQGHKDATDINKIIKKHATHASLAHAVKYPEVTYGVFDGEMDLLTARARIEQANNIFMDAPAEIRREFNNDALGS